MSHLEANVSTGEDSNCARSGGVHGISVRLLNPHVFPPGSDTTANKRARVSLYACTAGHFHAAADRWQTAVQDFGGPAADSLHVRGSFKAAVARNNLQLDSCWTHTRRENSDHVNVTDHSISPSLGELGGKNESGD